MSKESFTAFMIKVDENEGLREQLRGLGNDDDGVPFEAIAKLARSQGYEFTAEDVSRANELSNQELDSVSGGVNFSRTSFLKYAQKVHPGFGGSLFYKLR